MLKNTLYGRKYVDILYQFYSVVDPLLFQHDNAPVHKARSIKKWFSQFGVKELDCHAWSPDLNPIHHFQDEVDQFPRPMSLKISTLKPTWMRSP